MVGENFLGKKNTPKLAGERAGPLVRLEVFTAAGVEM